MIATDLSEALAPWQTPDLTTYVNAIGLMFAQVEELSEDTDEGEGWTILFDVDRCPAYALPYLAQFVGVTIPHGMPEAAARQLIRDAPNQRRGTPQSIIDRAKRELNGTKSVQLIERADNDAYKIRVITQTSESPSASVLRAAISEVKPAGIVLDLIITTGTVIDGLTGTIDSQTGTINTL